MIEHATQAEGRRAVTSPAINIRYRVTCRLTSGIHAMAGVTAAAQHLRPTVIRKGSLKTCRRVALTALALRVWMRWAR